MLSPIPIIFGKKRLLKTNLFPQNSFCMIKQAFFLFENTKRPEVIAHSAIENIPSRVHCSISLQWFQIKVLTAGKCPFTQGQIFSAAHRLVEVLI